MLQIVAVGLEEEVCLKGFEGLEEGWRPKKSRFVSSSKAELPTFKYEPEMIVVCEGGEEEQLVGGGDTWGEMVGEKKGT